MKRLDDYNNYFNRELSLIEFQRRVLIEAEGKQHPLLERLKFICILSSNLDEFFMIRVAGLKQQIEAGFNDLSYDGQTPQQQLKKIRKELIPIYKQQEELLNNDILPQLRKENIHLLRYAELKNSEKKQFTDYFHDNILPILTPLIIDSAHPFPKLVERSLNIAFIIRDKENTVESQQLAFLTIPNQLPRLHKMDRTSGDYFVLIESIIKENAKYLFPGRSIIDTNTFRVTRDADVEIAEDEAEDLLVEIQEQMRQRRSGRDAVKLEISHDMPDYLADLLRDSLELGKEDVYRHNRPLKLTDFMALTKLDKPELKDKPFSTRIPPEIKNKNIFEAIKKSDVMVHHPFDSFSNSTVRFLNVAATDPNVMSIKITLYRSGSNSAIIQALKKAAEHGKDVLAFVELKARFDEENNIVWARELEQSGVHVVYGVLGLKTHCKVCLVVRREQNKLKKYMHFSTGNYNHITARLYTDIALFTANEDLGMDSIQIFNYLTGSSTFNEWRELSVAPHHLAQKTIDLIDRETKNHTKDNPGLIIAKFNSLAQRDVIKALYRASMKGVKVKLIVRGICCLRPGIKGISDNIEVRSVIGRFLEHTRVFYFKNSGKHEYYISSADWMTRNLHKRVETMIPIHSTKIKNQLGRVLDYYWKDNTKSWILNFNGSYSKISPKKGEKKFNAQKFLLSIFNRKS